MEGGAEAIVMFILTVIFLMIAFIIYFLPSIIGGCRKMRNIVGLVVLNLLTGWLFLPWVGALVWSLSGEKKVEQQEVPERRTVWK